MYDERTKILEDIVNGVDKKYEWLQVLGAMIVIDEAKGEGFRPLLDKMAEFRDGIDLTHGGDGPHSRSPDFMIRRFARQLIAEQDGTEYIEEHW